MTATMGSIYLSIKNARRLKENVLDVSQGLSRRLFKVRVKHALIGFLVQWAIL